jgi:hypothetical protein
MSTGVRVCLAMAIRFAISAGIAPTTVPLALAAGIVPAIAVPLAAPLAIAAGIAPAVPIPLAVAAALGKDSR